MKSNLISACNVVLLLIAITGCKDKHVKKQLNITVVDPQHKALNNAKISVDGVHVGTTSKDGTFVGSVDVAEKANSLVVVSKDHVDGIYFGTQRRTIFVQEKNASYTIVLPTVGQFDRKSVEPLKQTSKEDTQPLNFEQKQKEVATSPATPDADPVFVDIPQIEPIAQTPKAKENTGRLITVHAFANNVPIAQAEVAWGHPKSGVLNRACTTNERGRCTFRLDPQQVAVEDGQTMLTIATSKVGYRTQFESFNPAEASLVRMTLHHGKSLDIVVSALEMGTRHGVADAAVQINGTEQGRTNSFGYFTYQFETFEPKALNVVIKANHYLPESTDLDIANPTPGILERVVARRAPPSPIDYELAAPKSVTTLMNLVEDKSSGAKNAAFSFQQSYFFGPKIYLKIDAVDSQGKRLNSALLTLKPGTSAAEAAALRSQLIEKLLTVLPVQATIVATEGETATINLGAEYFKSPNSNYRPTLSVLSAAYDQKQSFKGFESTAEAELVSVGQTHSTIKIRSVRPQKIGDIVLVNKQIPTGTVATSKINGIIHDSIGANIDDADVYVDGMLDNNFQNISDVDGENAKHSFVIIKPNFVPLEIANVSFKQVKGMRLVLKEDLSSEQVLAAELKRNTSPTEGIRSIARALIEKRQYQEAITLLNQVTSDSKDYLQAMHDIGEVYLLKLNDPVKAATFFEKITTHPLVVSLKERRFISAFVNEGISLYLAAERAVIDDPSRALTFYQRSHDVFSQVNTALINVPNHYQEKIDSQVRYYLALTKHKLWKKTGDDRQIANVKSAWQAYLDTKRDASKSQVNDENTRLYLNEIDTAALNKPKVFQR